MIINNKNEYRSVAKFWYKGKHYQMFSNDQFQLAYLIIDENGKYHYPTIEELIDVHSMMMEKPEGVQPIIKDGRKRKTKKHKFIPKVITGVGIVLLTTSLLTKIGDIYSSKTAPKNYETRVTRTVNYNSNDKKDYNENSFNYRYYGTGRQLSG